MLVSTTIYGAPLQLKGVELSPEEISAEQMAQELAAPHVNFYDPVMFQDLQAEVITYGCVFFILMFPPSMWRTGGIIMQTQTHMHKSRISDITLRLHILGSLRLRFYPLLRASG